MGQYTVQQQLSARACCDMISRKTIARSARRATRKITFSATRTEFFSNVGQSENSAERAARRGQSTSLPFLWRERRQICAAELDDRSSGGGGARPQDACTQAARWTETQRDDTLDPFRASRNLPSRTFRARSLAPVDRVDRLPAPLRFPSDLLISRRWCRARCRPRAFPLRGRRSTRRA